MKDGKALRRAVPRAAHAAWNPPADRPDPLALLEASNRTRLPELVAVRYQRMSASPFAFLRGSSIVMTHDLATATPVSGPRVQLCGDCHLENFGVYATPERNLIFEVTDFDEAAYGPWEWDVKRLATSCYVAAQMNGFPKSQREQAALCAARGYREQMLQCAGMHVLDVWYSRIDANDAIPKMRTAPAFIAQRYTEGTGTQRRFLERPPRLYHQPADHPIIADAHHVITKYRKTLRSDVRVVFERFELVDFAVKVVGVGSVGTRCAVALLVADDDDVLILQIKEAQASILEPFVGASPFTHCGERVVAGQRLMQAASDIFLGWAESADGRHYYVRQLSDRKGAADFTAMTGKQLLTYAEYCGRVLAMAHARSGDAVAIAGYLGTSTSVDTSVAAFAKSYCAQVERDYAKFLDATRDGGGDSH